MPLNPEDHSITAALNTARDGMKRGGAGKVKVHSGPIHSTVAGRTDHLPMHVASGSYVIPADIISAMGEGNSMAGFKVAKSIFSSAGPYGKSTKSMPYGGGSMPYGQPAARRASGGNAVADAKIAAGDTRVAANRAASANYAQQANQRDGTPIPSHLQGYGGGAPAGGGVAGGTGSFGLPNPSTGGLKSVFGITGPKDFIDGGGLGASGPTFKGGTISGAMNLLGVTPYSQKADGGPAEADGAVPIVAAGGEYVVSPEDVTHIGSGSMDDGHKVLDAFVKKMRKKTIRTLQS